MIICLLMEKKCLKQTIKMLTFQNNFVSEAYLMDLVLMSPEKYLKMERCMIIRQLEFYL